MPVIFSPGEAETRPLHPEAIVYTTAQKVADLLGIGPGEAVLASANTEADRVYVTGADYRSHGFAVGDTILIYSDAQALGVEKEITAVTEGGANGVALYFSPLSGVSKVISNISDYQTADNTYVQNQASFTNGKTRGMTRATVEEFIKRTQDRIDSEAHNAWRPTMVNAEYINFDTYKPYRRRYYTDYVGTSPLLFRNVQQVLRLEVWQGDDYRDLAGSEIRLDITDHSLLKGVAINTASIYMCPGGGGVAKLEVGTGTRQWDAGFNKVATAQNLADLINNEDRTNRDTVTFTTNTDSPIGTTYTQPDGSSSTGSTSVYVNNEFLATANADYGNGKLKITSMQQTKGGEEASMVIHNGDNALSLTSANTITSTMTYDADGGSGGIPALIGTGGEFAQYGVVKAHNVSGGDRIVAYTDKKVALGNTVLQGLTVLAGSSLVNDASYTVTQSKFQSDIGAFSDAGGDQARLKDWWIDHEMGIIYFNNSYPYFEWNAIKVAYIYGERYVEKAIEEAATKMVASDLLMSDDRSVLIPEGAQNVDLGAKIQIYRNQAKAILSRYKEIVVFA